MMTTLALGTVRTNALSGAVLFLGGGRPACVACCPCPTAASAGCSGPCLLLWRGTSSVCYCNASQLVHQADCGGELAVGSASSPFGLYWFFDLRILGVPRPAGSPLPCPRAASSRTTLPSPLGLGASSLLHPLLAWGRCTHLLLLGLDHPLFICGRGCPLLLSGRCYPLLFFGRCHPLLFWSSVGRVVCACVLLLRSRGGRQRWCVCSSHGRCLQLLQRRGISGMHLLGRSPCSSEFNCRQPARLIAARGYGEIWWWEVECSVILSLPKTMKPPSPVLPNLPLRVSPSSFPCPQMLDRLVLCCCRRGGPTAGITAGVLAKIRSVFTAIPPAVDAPDQLALPLGDERSEALDDDPEYGLDW